MTCKYKSSCKYYQDNSYTCNYNSGGDYCGTYRKSNGLGAKLLFISLFLFISLGIGGVLGVGTYPVVDPNMVLYYHFNNQSAFGENDTHVYDFSGNGNNGTVTGALWNSSGGYLGDGAFKFDGIDNKNIQTNYNISNLGSNFSFSFWMYADSTDSNYRDIIKSNNWATSGAFVCYYRNSIFACEFKNESATSFSLQQSSININNWYLFTLTGSSENIKLYLNGALVQTETIIGEIMGNSSKIFFGADSSNDFNGSLDELIFWNKTLSSNEVWSLYHNYLECITPNLNNQILGEGYTKICNGNHFINDTTSISINNNSIINFTGSIFIGNNTNGLLDFDNKKNITIYNLTAFNYTYAIIGDGNNFLNILYPKINTNSNGFFLIDNAKNVNITGGIFGKNNTVTTVSGVYFRFGGINISVENNYFYQCTAYGCIKFLSIIGENINIKNNFLNGNSGVLMNIVNSSNINIINNSFNDSNNNYDSYNVGIHLMRNNGGDFSSNILIENNSFQNIACSSILAQGGDNYTIRGNTFRYNQSYSVFKKGNCGYEAPTAIDLASIWKTWTSDSNESISDNITKIINYSSSNIIIEDNIFVNYPIFLRASQSINLTHDLSNYWFRSFATPNYLMPRQDYYISNSFNNVTTTFNETNNNPVIVRDLLGVGYMSGSTHTQFMTFKIYQNYLFFNNTNTTQTYVTSIFNQTSALAFNTNGSILCGGLVTGNCNITLAPNNASYVLDNFNLTEGVTRENSPFSFTITSDTSKHINSSIVDPVAVEISFNVAQCDTLGKITYTSGQDGYNRDFFPSDYSCSDNVVTLTATLEQSSESNEFEIQYGCSSITRASYRIIMLLLSVGILFMTAMFAKKRYEEGTINIKHILIIFLIITMAIVLWSSSAQTLGNSCGVIG